MARIDLHIHTTCSDGTYSPSDVVALARHHGITALAITDHDSVEGIPEALHAGRLHGIEIIPGVELSAQFQGHEVHLLGYFINWRDATLEQRLQQLRQSRSYRLARMVERIQHLGYSLSLEEVLVKAPSASRGRPHLAQVLVDKGYVRDIREAFTRFLAEGALAHVPGDFPEVETVIAWIREAGGVPVLAHPSWSDSSGLESTRMLWAQLQAAGLMGIEVYYSTHQPRQISAYRRLAAHLGLLCTGGSDFHGETRPSIHMGIGRGSLHIPTAVLESLRTAAGTG
ncbi:MAG: PHP domain-containing protein [Nitrospirae bacterium]|nr:MAG: PHP domain-containing protein [Nitrospirota bacterium]